MNRGSLIIYDNDGKIWCYIADAEGVASPHDIPNGIPYILTEYGEQDNKIVKSVDVSTTPHKIITEDIITKPSYEELETRLLEAEGVI
ncbi:hypothetical protein [Vallitalea maricola]|uniref:Uncharacterized protein n=1 Tax=Vallitalea maricola TaxID=3074433 RepID=A0ACB5UE45_9FIRM|nr:hypothetical protein AN2V17_04390 [Vallitalea sp. AN17-2]